VPDLICQKEPSVCFHCCWCLRSHEGFIFKIYQIRTRTLGTDKSGVKICWNL